MKKYRIYTNETDFYETLSKEDAEKSGKYEIIDEVEYIQPFIDNLNQMQFDELQPTDWCFIRQIETGIEVPKEILEQRQAIRDKYSQMKNKSN